MSRPRMEGNKRIADDDVTIAAGQVSAGQRDDPMGAGTVSEGHVTANLGDWFRWSIFSTLTCRGIRFGMM